MSEYYSKNELFVEPTTTQYGSHMVMSNVFKPNKKKYINIDTKFRDEYNYQSTTNYNLTLPERVTDVKNMTIAAVELPILYYNISSSLGNNSFQVIDNVPNARDVHLIVVPDGQYTASTLVSTINGILSSLVIFSGNTSPNDGDLQCILNGNHVQFYTNAASFTIDFTVNDQSMKDNYNFRYKLGWLLGFRKPSYNINFAYTDNPQAGTGPDGQPLTQSESTIDLNGPRYLYLAIEEFGKGNQKSFLSPIATGFINKNIIARISLDKTVYPYGAILPANKSNGYLLSDTRSYTGKIDLMKLNVQLLSEIGNPISLNDYDFSFCIEVEHE
jgi:hypothetical protein